MSNDLNNFKITFKNFKCYKDVYRSQSRVTSLLLELLEIPESFAIRYFHSSNKLIFNNFLKEFNRLLHLLRVNHYFHWEKDIMSNYFLKHKYSAMLNKCFPIYMHNLKKRVKFWKMVQENKKFLEEK